MRAGILDERTDGVDVPAGIGHDPHLTEAQKHALLRQYWAYRHENAAQQAGEPAGDPESHAG